MIILPSTLPWSYSQSPSVFLVLFLGLPRPLPYLPSTLSWSFSHSPSVFLALSLGLPRTLPQSS
ncbi:uncharacterized protein LOC143283487 [Babylonia areolata]|uniref:uncharacterized protein LOC143283487 n=1 Tax=Babylonia areolata TaxID=304850 RepID=UPI003FD68E6D